MGPNAANRRSLDMSNKRLSLGYASISYANDLQSNDLWTSRVASPDSRFDDFQRPTSRFHRFQALDTRPPTRYSTPPPTYQEARFESISENSTNEQNFNSQSSIQRPMSLTSVKTNRDSNLPQLDSLLEYSDHSAENADESKPKDETKHIKPSSLTKILKTVWPTLDKRERTILSSGFFAAFIVAIATPAFSIIFAKLLDTFYQIENRSSNAMKWSLALLGVAIINATACFCSHYALEHAGQAWVSALRVEALKRILSQPKSWFEESRNSPGRLNEILDRNSEEMRNLVGRFAGIVFTAFWMLLISVIWAFVNTWKLTLVSMACGPVIYAVTKVFNRVSGKWENKCNYASEITTSIFSETFSNIKVVRAFTLETYFQIKHTKATEELYKVGHMRANYSGMLWGLTDASTFFTTALVFYYATVLITNNEISVAKALQAVNLLIFGISNSTNLLAMVPQINSSRVTATHILELANLDSSSSHENKGTERLSSVYPVKFNRLSFTYPARPETRTLSSISLSIGPNSTTALVGASGSGKSTIAALLIGLYPPDTSVPPSLTFNGVSITNCHIQSLRASISLVPQTPILFPATILHNIIYGLPESSSCANLPSAIAAAKDAGIHEFITSLPQSYNTTVGDGGQELSGGQAQRIVIARALVRKPKLLILDEATSGLDGGSAEVVRETVQRLRKKEGMATLVVSHTVEMMKIAGRVVVMEEGKIVESGGFEELKNRVGGKFGALIGEGPTM
ncbi:ATP-dependent permease [Ciborinia camelliae]|nr:ATP-dependent permease [Ciborinia camelliae]